MREYNYPFVSWTHWPEDVSILASAHKPEDRRCEDARIPTNTHEPEDMWMWGYQ